MDTIIEVEKLYVIIDIENSKQIPNPAGLLCRGKDSDHFRSELNRWKEAAQVEYCADLSDFPFWETPQKYSCTRL